jgi:hypothetical protein
MSFDSQPSEHARASGRDSTTRYTEDSNELRSVIVLQVATLGIFKLLTSAMIVYFFPSWHALLVVAGLSVPWLIAGAWYTGWYSRLRLRLLRVRARRNRLLYEEWHVD